MPGRHQATAGRRSRLRWLAALAGGAALAAALVALMSGAANAAAAPVKATFGVTGVATSGCPVSAGGSDIYVKPGQALQVKSSLVGLYVNEPLGGLLGGSKKVDLNDVVGQIASLDGTLTIDRGTSHAIRFTDLTRRHTVSGLSAGNHSWRWQVSEVKLAGLVPLPLHIESSQARAGAKLTWTGTIHVTSHRTKCGIAIQLPSVSASASVKNLPPVQVGLPGAKVSVPVKLPHLPRLPRLPHPSLPTGGLAGSSSSGSGKTSAAPSPQNNPIPVPAQVVPGVNGGGMLGAGGFGLGAPMAGQGGGSGFADSGAAQANGGSSASPSHARLQASTGKQKAIDLAADRPSPTGELWVILAIGAVIALAFIAATYARLYLMKHRS